ncbi:MAG TPA: c-type cytochrome [Comamonas sp.]|uniref:c-type cytochrome n=1 Tax=Comamonas halotolerans TaxID=3041496 RepID=UPI0024E1150C|nr:c-type cytochrome [Comamonas sp. NoAH]
MKLLASLLTAAALAAPALPAFAAGDTPAKPDLAKGQAIFESVCVACHAADGNSTIVINPKLAQQHPEYLLKQLHDFRDDKRIDPVMKGFATMFSEEELRNVTAWVSTQPAKPGFATDKELVTIGERIYRGGVPDRKIAACVSCHSPNGAGIPAQYPRLSGQHAEYTVKQLNAFRDGSRANNVQMTDVAAKLNDREIKAVADYIAGLR